MQSGTVGLYASACKKGRLTVRLDKFLSDSGLGTRSLLRARIKSGSVTVNGDVVNNPGFQVSESDSVVFSGKAVSYQKYVYLMMNKPSGVVSATEDREHKTVTDLLDGELKGRGLFPVGRLDIDTEGLLLLTDDGAFAHSVTAPSRKVDKTYYLKTERPTDSSYAERFAEGVFIPGGHKTLPAVFKILSEYEALLTISEGKFHQVKYMLEAVGNRVVYLKRLSIGKLKLDEALSPGEYRPLLPSETVF